MAGARVTGNARAVRAAVDVAAAVPAGPRRPARACEFELEGHRCVVAPLEPRHQGASAGEQESGWPVIGLLTVSGRAYLVHCAPENSVDSLPPGQGDAEPVVADMLTERELQIAVLVSRGRLNKQIAHQLHISEYTVSTHLRRIYNKLGVSSRAAMVARILEGG